MATGTPYTSDNLSSASCRKVTCQPTQSSIPAAAPEIILVETVKQPWFKKTRKDLSRTRNSPMKCK
jgi:hypothetical protein